MGELGEINMSGLMTKMSANDAKARFGELLDKARREAVTIEKHGRPVAVMLSIEDYEELETLKLSSLRAEIDEGMQAAERGDVVEPTLAQRRPRSACLIRFRSERTGLRGGKNEGSDRSKRVM